MIEYLNFLTRKEIINFGKFINSPYFNSVKLVQKLFNHLKPIYPHITEQDIDNKLLFSVTYPGKKFDDVKIRKLKSNFRKVFEDFLTQCELEHEYANNKPLLLRALRKKGVRKEFELNLNLIKKEMRSNKFFSKNEFDYLQQVYLSNEEYYHFYSVPKYDIARPLQIKSDNLDLFFAFMKLHTFHEMLLTNYNKGEGTDFKKTYFREIFDFIEKNKNNISIRHPNLYIIYLVYLMYSDPDKKYSKEFIEYLKKFESKFSKYQLSHYYRYLESYYWTKINEGFTEFRKDVLKIYKLMISKKIFVLDEHLKDNEFNNVINISLPLGEYNWTEIFIENHYEFLKSELANETYNLAKAKLYFYQKEFQKSLGHINNIHYKDSHYYLNSNLILTRALYELKSFESISYVLSGMNQYTRRGKDYLNDYQKKLMVNYIKYFRSLLKFKELKNKNKLFILKKELLNEKNFIAGKEWFIEKIEELEKPGLSK